MAAAVIKGILFSIGIIAALGLAVMESPPIQAWLEEQRRRIAELLRSIGEELDPQSRRAAEAFAFEGRTPANDEGLRREASASLDAAALATGRSMSSASTTRRIPIRTPSDDEAEERRKKGREYLARRNEQLLQLQQRQKAAAAGQEEDLPSPTSFDAMVDEQGHLKSQNKSGVQLPSPPSSQPIPEHIQSEMRQVERALSTPISPLVGGMSTAGARGWDFGSIVANPFDDEYALERSITPKPPVPPKLELERAPTPEISVPEDFPEADRVPSPEISVPGGFHSAAAPGPRSSSGEINTEGLSYEEQLAIAMSLSEQQDINSATIRQNQPEDDDRDLHAAIAASLRDMDHQQAAHAIAHAESSAERSKLPALYPLVDVSSTSAATWQRPWAASPVAPSEASDELYSITPQLTRARLASHNAQQPVPDMWASEALEASTPNRGDLDQDASFHSAASKVPPPSNSHILARERPTLVDVEDDTPHDGTRTPTSRIQSSFSFHTDSDSEIMPSRLPQAGRAQSGPSSETSNVEVIDVVDDSDIDMLSEEGDGIVTPDSWSEIESRDAESEAGEDVRLGLHA